MPGGCQPIPSGAIELITGHPGVRRHYEVKQTLYTGCTKRLMVVFEHRLKRLGSAPLRVLRSQRFDAVKSEGELNIEGLLGPERPIVVEDGNPRCEWHVVGAVLVGHCLNEREDVPLRFTVIPGWQRIGLRRIGSAHVDLPRLETRWCERAGGNGDNGQRPYLQHCTVVGGEQVPHIVRSRIPCLESEAYAHDDGNRQPSAVVVDVLQPGSDELIHLGEPAHAPQAHLDIEVHL